MELRHFRYFIAVAEEANMTRAAARLGLAQPPLSQQIRALEQQIGTPLFLRLPRGMALTAAGTAFLHEARRVLEGAELARARAVQAARGEEGTVTVGVTTSAVLHPLVGRVFRAFTKRHPRLVLTIEEGNAADLTEALERRRIEAAFIRAPVSRPPGVALEELTSEPLMVVVPAGHRLAGQATVRLAALRDERFVLTRRPSAPGMYDDVLLACRASGFEPVIAAEVVRMLTNLTLVAAGVGVSLVPSSMRSIHLAGVRFLGLAAPRGLRAPLTIGSVLDNHDPIAANLLALARELAFGQPTMDGELDFRKR